MEVKKITIIGSGIMGHGIAQAAIFSGYEVVLYDIDQGMLDKAVAIIKDNIEKRFVAKGKITKEEGAVIFARLTTSINLEKAAKEADLVIEAAPEILDLKKKIFAQLDDICPAHTVLATNTSAQPVTAIAGATKRKEKCVGMHFFNPAAVMKLVEVVLPIGVSEETVATALDVARKMGKTPVTTKDLPGFIVNRLLGLLYKEAAQMVYEGAATAEEIDTAMKLGAGHPLGPCELADMGGLDLIKMGGDQLYAYTGKESDKPNILYTKMVEAGRFGKKNGKGFYEYLPDGTKKSFKLF